LTDDLLTDMKISNDTELEWMIKKKGEFQIFDDQKNKENSLVGVSILETNIINTLDGNKEVIKFTGTRNEESPEIDCDNMMFN